MPIWLRTFTFRKIQEYYDDQNSKDQEKAEQSWLKGGARDEAKKHSQPKKPTYSSTMKKASGK
jgi:hypothetical protein|tara:strand:+ start:760 stop:948 length:189 start_codon:yes stop_codon:yes gene_type:complete